MSSLDEELMKKLYLCVILALPSFSFAQSPCSGTQVTLSSQAEVDNYPSQYCSQVCSLTINGNDITNLDSLYVVQSVGRLVITFNPVLNDISGLSNLAVIENSCVSSGMEITNNNFLTNVDGLSSLERVVGPVNISGNTMLNDLTGLSNLSEVDALIIGSNASLQDLDGLESLSEIGGDMIIESNPALANTNGLLNVSGIQGALVVRLNDALADLDGLSNLTFVRYQLSISYNDDLIDLQALSNVNHIGQFSASGASLEILNNQALASLNGLQGLDSIPGTATIEGNDALVNLDGLSSLRSLDPPLGYSYNSGIRIARNEALTDISGIAGVQTIGRGRSAYFEITSNASLGSLDSLQLQSITGSLVSRLMITENDVLEDIDGLASLTTITSGLGSAVVVSDNPSLQNVDGLSGLTVLSSSRGGTLTVTNNTELGEFCGLYAVVNSATQITITGNERNPSKEEIRAAGPCGAVTSQPTNLVFSSWSSDGMRVRFNRGAYVSGYLVLMKAYGPSAPDDLPQDGITYSVGQVIGSSSIVAHVGSDTTFMVSGLIPSTPYYFDVFAYTNVGGTRDYITANPLEGRQSTTTANTVANSLLFSDVTDESITVALNEPAPGNYIALMRAFSSPSPVDVPEDGRAYHVGGTIGSSTIIVNIGDGSAFTVHGLMPNVKYYFDIYSYEPATLMYASTPAKGNQVTSEQGEDLFAYPNPFEATTTIPFVVSKTQSAVQVSIFDSMGRVVTVLTEGNFGRGRHEASWDGSDKNGSRVVAGMYIYSVKSDSGVVTGRVSLR